MKEPSKKENFFFKCVLNREVKIDRDPTLCCCLKLIIKIERDQSHDEFGSYELEYFVVGANKLLDEFDDERLLFVFKYSSSLSDSTSGLSLTLYVKHRLINV